MFGYAVEDDFPKCDLLIVIGTSLTVFPFAGLVELVPPGTPRVLVNRELAGEGLLDFESEHESGGEVLRDVALLGDCQDTARQLALAVGWEADLRRVVETFQRPVDDKSGGWVDDGDGSLVAEVARLGLQEDGCVPMAP